MATQYLPLDQTKPLGAALFQGVRQLQEGIAQLVAIQQTMVQMLTPSNDTTVIDAAFCVNSGDGAQVKGELDSLLGKLTTDASVDHVLAARNQMAAKIGVV